MYKISMYHRYIDITTKHQTFTCQLMLESYSGMLLGYASGVTKCGKENLFFE